MKKSSKWILGIVGAVVLVVVVVAVVIVVSIDGIIRSTVERESTESLNLQTQVGSANLAIFGRTLTLSDMQIASPEGYDTPRMFNLDDIGVRVSFRELRQDPIRIAEINIERPMLIIEQRGTEINLRSAMDGLPPTEPAEEPIRMIIGRLRVNDAQVRLQTDLPGIAGEYAITLPPLDLEDIGTGDDHANGAAIREVVMQLATAMAAQASESDQIPAELRQLLNLNIDAILADFGAEARRRVEEAADDLRERVREQVGDIIDDPERVLEDPGAEIDRRLQDLRGLDPRRPRERPRENAQPAD